MQKSLLFCVHCRVTVTSAKPELRKNECNAMKKDLLFCVHCRVRGNFGEVRVTHKTRAMQCKKACFLRTLPSAGNFDELAPTILKSFFSEKKRQFVVFYLAYSYIIHILDIGIT